MAMKVTPETLHQHWVHSHEEDTETEMVFRPATFSFPRSRGRTAFQLKPDGSLVEFGIGPTDRRQETRGTWKLEGEKVSFYAGAEPEPRRVLIILSVDRDRLIIKK